MIIPVRGRNPFHRYETVWGCSGTITAVQTYERRLSSATTYPSAYTVILVYTT
jgi:hypothetical protein